MDAYLEEELYDILTYCIQNPNASDLISKRHRIEEVGRELYTDGGVDAMENIFYPLGMGYNTLRITSLLFYALLGNSKIPS